MAKNKVSVEHSQQIRCFYQVWAVSGGKLLQMFPQYCKAVINNHSMRAISDENKFDKRKLNKERYPKVTIHDQRRFPTLFQIIKEQQGCLPQNSCKLKMVLCLVAIELCRIYFTKLVSSIGNLERNDFQKRVTYQNLPNFAEK